MTTLECEGCCWLCTTHTHTRTWPHCAAGHCCSESRGQEIGAHCSSRHTHARSTTASPGRRHECFFCVWFFTNMGVLYTHHTKRPKPAPPPDPACSRARLQKLSVAAAAAAAIQQSCGRGRISTPRRHPSPTIVAETTAAAAAAGTRRELRQYWAAQHTHDAHRGAPTSLGLQFNPNRCTHYQQPAQAGKGKVDPFVRLQLCVCLCLCLCTSHKPTATEPSAGAKKGYCTHCMRDGCSTHVTCVCWPETISQSTAHTPNQHPEP